MKTTLVKPIVSTIYGVELQASMFLGNPYRIRQGTTLNEKFGVQSGITHNVGTYPKMSYFCIGNGGHRSKVGADGIEVGESLQHTPRHAALFKHLPFVIREPNNDLSPHERERFALRKVEDFNGRTFISYYLRRLNLETVSTELQYQSIVIENDDAKVKTTAFEATAADLNPIPEPLSTVEVNTLAGDYVRCESIVTIPFSKWDLDELKNAANIMYGSDNYAIISEIGLVSGVDKVVEASNAGSSNFNYKEVISAQIVAHISTDFRARYHNKDADLSINIGASEPMYSLVAP